MLSGQCLLLHLQGLRINILDLCHGADGSIERHIFSISIHRLSISFSNRSVFYQTRIIMILTSPTRGCGISTNRTVLHTHTPQPTEMIVPSSSQSFRTLPDVHGKSAMIGCASAETMLSTKCVSLYGSPPMLSSSWPIFGVEFLPRGLSTSFLDEFFLPTYFLGCGLS